MAAEVRKEIELEIAHVLFIDIVGYSKLSINDQHAAIEELNRIVRASQQFQRAEAANRLIRIPTGDGMVLVFYANPEAPAQCAVEISCALKKHPRLQLRMGIHSGPLSGVLDVNERANLAGAGINMAKRVMDCGDAGHILLSKHVAEDLEEYEKWRPFLHDLGTCEAKHGVRVSVVNLYDDQFGNAKLPRKFETVQKRRARVLWAEVAVALLVLAAIIAAFVLLLRRPTRSALAVVEKSIAVLPFENRSEDKANAYFTDGVQDEILTDLAKIADLKVISRTSVMQYKSGVAHNLREIAQQLGVANVVEGSVQRSGNRVRVNAQLVDARTDAHLWAQTYDRDLADVFAIQSEIAREIANALQAKLSPSEQSQMARKPTENGEAYLAFVQAHNLSRAVDDFDKLKQSEQLYERAIELDPKFALAMARYSQLESWIVHMFERTPERREKAQTLAERALQLQPDLPEAHLARGFSYYYGDDNYDAALKEFEIARSGLPNESEVYSSIGAIQRRQGKWAESTANLEKAVSLNPKDIWAPQNLAFNYWVLRNFDKANEAIDRALALDPTALDPLEVKSELAVAEKGDFSVAEKAFDAVKSAPMTAEDKLKTANARADVFLLERKYREGLKAAESLPDDQLAALPGALGRKYYEIGFARKALQDTAGAHEAFLKAKNAVEEELKRSPDVEKTHVQLAKVLAQLGERDAALAEAQRATELLPESKDAFGGPEITAGVAEVYTILGDNARAIEVLDGLLSRPSFVTVQGLKVNPIWDPLRSDPRFEKLAASPAPKDR
jgi:TolB-like protein/Tfp pilus assembly protein PilF/class 3 adenylate cyclase